MSEIKTGDKFVTIRRRGQSRIPTEVYSSSSQKIGCGFIENTKDIMRGLSDIQEELILPKIIGVPYDHVNFIQKAQDFYCDLDVIVPIEGLRLNISTSTKKHKTNDGTEVGVELPKLPMDYIQYVRCLIHSEVAKNREALDTDPKYNFYIEDETLELKIKVDTLKVKNDAQYQYLQLVAEDKAKENIEKITQILTVLKPLHNKVVRGMSLEDKTILLDEVVTKHPEEFTKTATDKHLVTKVLIEQGLEYKLIKVIGGTYFDRDDEKQELGSTTDDFVTHLESPKGSAYLMQLKARIKEAKK